MYYFRSNHKLGLHNKEEINTKYVNCFLKC